MFFVKNKKKKQFKPDLIYSVLTVVFIAGVIYGAFSAYGSNAEVSVLDVEGDFWAVITKTCMKNIRSLSYIILFSFSAFGFPVIIYLTYLEGFSLSAALSLMVVSANCGIFKGILICIPTFAFAVAAFVLISKSGILLSIEIFKCIFLRGNKNMFNNLIKCFFYVFIISLGLMIMSGFSESLMRKIFT